MSKIIQILSARRLRTCHRCEDCGCVL